MPIGWLYITYHLLREPETAIEQRGFLFKKNEVLSFCFSSFTVVCQVHQRKEGNLLQESGETFAKACAPPWNMRYHLKTHPKYPESWPLKTGYFEDPTPANYTGSKPFHWRAPWCLGKVFFTLYPGKSPIKPPFGKLFLYFFQPRKKQI